MNTEQTRLEHERRFHDQWSAAIDIKTIDVVTPFEGSTAPENRFLLSRLGDVTGKHLLDLGCGAGESSVYFAKKGARCVACDLSPGMVKTARSLAAYHQVNIEARTINAMRMDFPDNSFDIVYESNMLHHVDEKAALSEIYRVLKPGGTACMWEPLGHNPVINVYRKIARQVRTADERPMDIHMVDRVGQKFSKVSYDTFWIATQLILLRFFFIERVNPNKERYWKKIYTDEPRLRDTYYRLEKIDRMLKKLPFVKKYAWTIAITAIK